MTDWDIFTESVSWFVADDATINLDVARDPAAIANGIRPHFPALADLLCCATTTGVNIDCVQHELLAWDSADGERVGWLCLPPPSDVPDNVCKPHRLLLTEFGGVIERFNEPEDTRLLNHNSVLTNHDASFYASFIKDYSWAFDGNIPINTSDYYTIAREANGKTTICHRVDCSVLLFAPDHAFNEATPFNGCPEFTLYNLHDVSTLTEWVELIARQWLRNTTNVA